jgi:hypothetical protein
MNCQKLVQQMFGLALISLISVGCAGASTEVTATPTSVPSTFTPTTVPLTTTPTPLPPSPTPTSAPGPKAGFWEGEDVSFTVTKDGLIKEFEFMVGGSSGCRVTTEDELPIMFNDVVGSFNINPEGVTRGNSFETATDFKADATFDTETTLSGMYSVQLCGGSLFFNQIDIAWSAEWQGL